MLTILHVTEGWPLALGYRIAGYHEIDMGINVWILDSSIWSNTFYIILVIF